MRKGQVKRLDGRDSVGQAKFVGSLFGVAALAQSSSRPTSLASNQSLQRNQNFSSLIFAFTSLFCNQHNVAGLSPAFGDDRLAVGRPGETKNRLGREIR